MTNFSKLSKEEKYILYKKFKKSDFTEPKSFLYAEFLGIKKQREYNDFIESDFVTKDSFGGVYFDTKDYENYKELKKSGWDSKKVFEEAKDLGFNTPKEYNEYKQGGYKSKNHYDWVKKTLPNRIKELNKKNKDIRKESEDLFKTEFYSNAFQTRFILLEKKIEESYMKKYGEDYPKNMAHLDCFNELSKQYKDLDQDEFHKWRLLRNQITHDHIKIEKVKVEEGIAYIE